MEPNITDDMVLLPGFDFKTDYTDHPLKAPMNEKKKFVSENTQEWLYENKEEISRLLSSSKSLF